jgi:hypothetical protein
LLLDGGGQKGTAPRGNILQKIRNLVKLAPMNNPSLSQAKSWANRFDGSFATTKAGGKILPAFSSVTH